MEEKNFFKKVFDFSFKEFVTLDIIKIIYGILLVLVGISAIACIIGGFSSSFLAGIGGIVIAVVVAFLGTIGARIWCEIVLILFRIEANTKKK
jgi:small-conductance mechanosensitive channel